MRARLGIAAHFCEVVVAKLETPKCGAAQRLAAAQNRDQVFYLAESVYKVVLQKSIPAQIRQLILYDYYYE
jgi:hypothetical protein